MKLYDTNMQIRKSQMADQNEISTMIRDTVLQVNSADYSPEQLMVWSNKIHAEMMKKRFGAVIQYVAIDDGKIVGIGDIDIEKQELDFLYTHKDFVRKGVGSQILSKLEEDAKGNGVSTLQVTASITAKPFFEKRGYHIIVEEYQKDTDGVMLTVFRMKKNLALRQQ